MRSFLRSLIQPVVTGAIVGFVVLGIGGRVMMRIIAIWEGRVPVLTSGTITVLFMGVVAGVAGGVIYGILRWWVKQPVVQFSVYLAICVLFTWRGVNELLFRPKLLFVAITIVYCVLLAGILKSRHITDAGGIPNAA